MSEQVFKLVKKSIEQVNGLLERKIPIEQGRDCLLFGADGVLDSMGLVSLIVNVEETIEANLDVTLILANEKSMSQRNSPFLTVGRLCDYIDTLLQETNHGH